MATLRQRYVNTGTDASPNAAGGNGTTNVSDPGGTDPNRAYATLAEAETAENSDISLATGSDEYVVITCSGSKADTTYVSISGWTTAAGNYLLIGAASTDRALITGWDAGRYHMQVASGNTISVNEEFVRLDGLQLYSADAVAHLVSVLNLGAVAAANQLRVSNCRIKCPGNASYRTPGIRTADADANVYIWNTIIEGMSTANNAGNAGIYVDNCTAVNIINCIVYGAGTGSRGINCVAGTVNVWNTAVLNHVDDFTAAGTLNVDHCASDDNDGTNNVAETGGGADWTGDFVDGSAGDWTLLVNSGLVGTGTADPTTLGFGATDIVGTARGAAWDLGPFEYVAAGGTTYTMVCADSIALGDSGRSTAAFLASASDGLVLGDGGLGPALFPRMSIDSIALGDLSVFVRTTLGAATDSVALGDTAARIATLLGIAADSVALGDTALYTVLGAVEAFAADSVGLSDSARATATYLVAAGDAITLGDYSQRTFTVQVIASDGVALGDATIVQVAAVAQAVDGISLSDAATALAAYIAAATDGIALQDVSISAGVAATGVVTVTFTTAKGSVTITTKRPTVTLTVKEPSVILS